MPDEIYNPGLEGVIAGETAVSTIAGGLLYRGYAIEDLASHASFEEVAFLLLHEKLPTGEDLADFRTRLGEAAAVPAQILEMLKKLPARTSPMDVLRTSASMIALWDPDRQDNSHDANVGKAERLLAQLPVLTAARHRIKQGKEPVAADSRRSLAENLLWMLFRREPKAEHVRAIDVSLILYAEHEFNASTFTARVICSTLADLHSGIVGATAALKGPLHGGANERVMEVLQEVGTPDKAEAWVRQALDQKRRIMGFGHRVYKDGDPRAAFLKPLCADLAKQTGNQRVEETADTIERIVRDEKKLPPNLDWPSARLYHYLGIPVELYTPLFVLSRVAGWSAHVIEQHDANRLIRPRSRYTGPPRRDWLPMESR